MTARPFAALLALVVAGSACKDDPASPDGPLAPDGDELKPGIHTLLALPATDQWVAAKEYEVRLHLKAVDIEGEVSSFQGELRYDHGVIEIVEAGFPDGLMGAWNETRPGVMRFAAVSLESVDARPALELVVTSTRPVRSGDFTVVLEEVIATEAFENLTPKVAGDAPILVHDGVDAGRR